MQHEAARPKSPRSLDDEPMSQPMRPSARGQIARNPSSDQKRVRRANQRKVADFNEQGNGASWVPGQVSCRSCGHTGQPRLGDGTGANCARCGSYSVSKTRPGQSTAAVTATIRESNAEWLNPGDSIRTPNGKTQKVNRVRPHETSADHVYVDTDGGTALVKRTDRFQVVPDNNQQQSLPGYGTPGGNSNRLPFDPQSSAGGNSAPSSQCPVCGTKNSLSRSGDHYTCSRCGYREQFGGAGGNAFSDSPQVVRTFSTINRPTQSVIARRAQQVLDQKETHL
jgi:ribosomal protein L37AE/L43A